MNITDKEREEVWAAVHDYVDTAIVFDGECGDDAIIDYDAAYDKLVGLLGQDS